MEPAVQSRLDSYVDDLGAHPGHTTLVRKLIEPFATKLFAGPSENDILPRTNGHANIQAEGVGDQLTNGVTNGHVTSNTKAHVQNEIIGTKQVDSDHDGREHAYTGGLKHVMKEVDLPGILRATLASKIGEIILDDEGWVGPLSPDYVKLCEFNWASNCHMYPTCILRPASPPQVAQIVTTLTTLKVPFAIRSGGHQPCPGYASVGGDAVLIDMSRLNDIKLAEDKQTISFGPGGTWRPIYELLEGSGVSVIGGRTGEVGIGGLILGGGLPSFSSEFGLVCDNVEEFQVVLSDGSIVIANRSTNNDLFWALKGGSANFGIVTQFTLRTVPIDRIWFETRLYDPSQNHALLEGIEQWQKVAENDAHASIVHHIGHNKTMFGFIYSKPEPYPDVYKMFYDIPFVTNFHKPTIGRLIDFSRDMGKVLGPQRKLRRNDFGIATRPSAEFYKRAHDKWRALSNRLMAETSGEIGMGVQPITSGCLKVGRDRGTNALNCKFEPQQWMNSLTQWTDSADDDKIMEAVQEFGDYLLSTAKELDVFLDWIFLNNATMKQDPIGKYGPENVLRLKAVSQKYDPQQVFQSLQSNGFLLRKVTEI